VHKFVIPAKAGIQTIKKFLIYWIPAPDRSPGHACARMTVGAFTFLSLFFLPGCQQVARVSPVRIPFTQVVPEHTVSETLRQNPPQRVAVLPFLFAEEGEMDEDEKLGQEIFRRTFFNDFSTLGYADINLNQIDQKLQENHVSEKELYTTPDWKNLGSLLNADAVILAQLNKISNFTGGVYSETEIKGEMWMVDTRSGEELWRVKHGASSRGGLLLKSGTVMGFIEGEEENSQENLAFLKVAELYSRHVVGTIPDVDLRDEAQSQAAALSSSVTQGKGPLIAVLPFKVSTGFDKEMALYLRRRLIANLREEGMRVLESQQVDQWLTQNQEGLQDLALDLGAQVIVEGRLTELNKEYLVVHSQVSIEAEVSVLEAKECHLIDQFRRRQVRTAGLLQIPTSLTSIATQPVLGLDDHYVFEMVNDLARDLAQPIVYLLKD